MVVLMANKDAFARPSHSMLLVVFFQPSQARKHRRVFFGLIFLGAKGVVAQRIQSNRLGLI